MSNTFFQGGRNFLGETSTPLVTGLLEPAFLLINKNDFEKKVNTDDNVRLDISFLREDCGIAEITFFDNDTGITHPNPTSVLFWQVLYLSQIK